MRFECSLYEIVPYLCSDIPFLPMDNHIFSMIIKGGRWKLCILINNIKIKKLLIFYY